MLYCVCNLRKSLKLNDLAWLLIPTNRLGVLVIYFVALSFFFKTVIFVHVYVWRRLSKDVYLLSSGWMVAHKPEWRKSFNRMTGKGLFFGIVFNPFHSVDGIKSVGRDKKKMQEKSYKFYFFVTNVQKVAIWRRLFSY